MMHACLLGPDGFIAGAGLPLTDRGFRYGMSVFETIAIRDSTPLLLEAHLAKLEEAVAAAGFHAPPWREGAYAAFAQPAIREGVARLYVTGGDEDVGVSRVALVFEDMPISTVLSRTHAFTVEFSPALPFGKTGNYWPHLRARPADGGDAILCSPAGRLLGGSMSNLVLVLDGAFFTPRAPIRRGVVRDWIGAAEADLTRSDLAGATSAFLTNSRIGIRALSSIDGRALAPDPQIEELWQRYCAEVLHVG